jgi:Tol biopolymer transport system component/DNA-binding winged helix-turn-helix (wHTH) protein
MSSLYEFGRFRLEPDEERLLKDGVPVSLTPKVFATLVTLVRRAGTLVDKDALMREVWPDSHVEDANITVNVSTLRRALGDGVDGERFIETVPKRGYRFVAPVRVLDAPPRSHAPIAAPPPASPDAPPAPVTVATPPPAAPAATPAPSAAAAPGVTATGAPPAVTVTATASTPLTAPLPRRRFWKILAGVVPGAGLAAVLGSLAYSRSSAKKGGFSWERMATQGKLRLLLPSETGASTAAISPAGHMLAYVAADVRGRPDLFVAQVNGGGQLRLTGDDARETQPVFSPDGRSLAFTRRQPPSPTPEICIVPALGGRAPRAVVNGVDPAWSPQGTRLAFVGPSRTDGPQALFTCNLDGGDTRLQLSADGAYPFLRNPAWSPDGRTIAVVRSPGGVAGEIWLVPVDGGQPERFTEKSTRVWCDWPRFTADGASILHSSSRGGATNLWVQSLEQRAPIRLTTGPGPDEVPSISRDGAVVFVNSRGRNELLIHDTTSGATRTLLTHSPYLWAPVLSPDGRDIAFSRGEVDGSWHIWTLPASGGAPRQLTSGSDSEIYPRYTRDGAWILFQTRGAPGRIWILPRNGGTPKALTKGDHEDGYADPSPDGTQIAFARADGEERVHLMPIGGGAARRLIDRPSTVPQWSPDGTLIAFSPGRGYSRGIFVINADGTGERRLTERGGWPVWWPDGRRISYIMIDIDGSQQIWTVPLAGGAPTLMESLPFPDSSNCPFSIAHDGRSIIGTRVVRMSHEIWLLEPPPPTGTE